MDITHKKIRLWRKSKNLTQKQAALACGVSERTWQNWESPNCKSPKRVSWFIELYNLREKMRKQM